MARELWQFWKAYSRRAADYQAVILLTLVYYCVLGPSALVARLAGKQLLPPTIGPAPSYWREREALDNSLVALERPY